MALLHIERAAAGLGDWEVAHTWLTAATNGPISAGPNATLFVGAPAMAFALHAAARPGRYERALESLDIRVAALNSIKPMRGSTAGTARRWRSSISSTG